MPCEALTYIKIPAGDATSKLYVGGCVYYAQNLHGVGIITCDSIGRINLEYKVNKIQLSFY